MPVLRYFSSIAAATTLAGSVSAANTTIQVASTTGFPPSTPYTLALDYGSATVELVDVTSVAGTTLTVTRGVDGTSAQSHSLGAVVRHTASGRDFADYQAHQAATAAHGVAGALVGTTDSQTMTNKTLNGGTLTGTFTGSPTFSSAVTLNGGVVSFSGGITGDGSATLRLNNTTNVTLASSGHAFQVGASTGANLRASNTEVQAVNNGATAPLDLNQDGGNVRLFGGVSSTAATETLQIVGAISASPTNTGAINHFFLNAPSGASTSANLALFQTNASNRLVVKSTGHTTISTGGNTAGVALNVIAETGQTANLITAQVAASPVFSVSASGNTTVAGDLTVTGVNGAVRAWKTASTSRASTTALVADPDLVVSVVANATYELQAFFLWSANAGSTAGDYQYTFNGPTGSTGWWATVAPSAATTTEPDFVRGIATAMNGAGRAYGIPGTGTFGNVVSGMLTTAGTAGTLALVWGQGTSSTDATILNPLSWLRLTRVA